MKPGGYFSLFLTIISEMNRVSLFLSSKLPPDSTDLIKVIIESQDLVKQICILSKQNQGHS